MIEKPVGHANLPRRNEQIFRPHLDIGRVGKDETARGEFRRGVIRESERHCQNGR